LVDGGIVDNYPAIIMPQSLLARGLVRAAAPDYDDDGHAAARRSPPPTPTVDVDVDDAR
jgi:hypothetical protein